MEEKIMSLIKKNLIKLKNSGEKIDDIKMYYNLEQNLTIKYKYNNEYYFICNELLEK